MFAPGMPGTIRTVISPDRSESTFGSLEDFLYIPLRSWKSQQRKREPTLERHQSDPSPVSLGSGLFSVVFYSRSSTGAANTMPLRQQTVRSAKTTISSNGYALLSFEGEAEETADRVGRNISVALRALPRTSGQWFLQPDLKVVSFFPVSCFDDDASASSSKRIRVGPRHHRILVIASFVGSVVFRRARLFRGCWFVGLSLIVHGFPPCE